MKVRIITDPVIGKYDEIILNQEISGKSLLQRLNLEKANVAVFKSDGKLAKLSKIITKDEMVTIYVIPQGMTTAITIAIFAAVLAFPFVAMGIDNLFKMANIPSPTKVQTSPSLRGSSNNARKNQKLPILLGRHLVYPDLAAIPFSTYNADDQYLTQAFCFGYNNVLIDETSLKIGSTPLSKYHDVVKSSNLSSLYPKRVIESYVGLKLENKGTATEVIRTTSSNTNKIIVGLAAPNGLYKYNNDGNKEAINLGLKIQWKTSEGTSWTTAYNSTQSLNKEVHRQTVEITPTGSTSGTYDVRVSRTTKEDESSSTIDFIYFDFLSCYTKDSTGSTEPIKQPLNYSLLAIKIKASNQLNGIVDSLNAICTLRSRIYTNKNASGPSAWTVGDARNPAAALLYLLTDSKVNPRAVPDSMIDWPSFEAFYNFCELKGFNCDAFIANQEYTIEQLCEFICSSNLARLSVRSNTISLVIEEEIQYITQMFTPRNASGITMSKDYSALPSILKAKFTSADADYTEVERTVKRNSDNSISYDSEIADDEEATDVSLFGVTNPKHAAIVMAVRLKQLNSQNRVYSWNTDIEGILCQAGDICLLSTDSFLYGLGEGYVKRINGNQITVDSDFTMVEGFNYGIRVRGKNGVSNPISITTIDGTTSTITVADSSSIEIGDLINFGYLEAESRKVQIKSITVSNKKECSIEAVDYDPSVFDTDEDSIPNYDSGISKHPEGTVIGGGKIDAPDKPLAPAKPGLSGSPGVSSYVHIRYSAHPDGTDFDTSIKTYVGIATTNSKDAPTNKIDYTWSKLIGDAGRGIANFTMYYGISSAATTIPSSWSTTPPTRERGQYLWSKERTHYTDGSSVDTNPIMVSGADGSAGKGIVSKTMSYAINTSPTTAPTTGWQSTPPTKDIGQYLWSKETTKYTEGVDTITTPIMISGHDGIGKDGVSVSSIVAEYGLSSTATTQPSSWSTTRPNRPANQFLWMRDKVTYSDKTVAYVGERNITGDKGDSVKGDPGTSLSKVSTEYGLSSSSTIAPTLWQASQPARPTGQFLWVQEVFTYSNGTIDRDGARCVTGDKGDTVKGDPGRSIESVSIEYSRNTSQTTAPTTGWQTTMPAISGSYVLWIRDIYSYSDGTTETIGTRLATGTGVRSITIQYVISDSSTTYPTTGWSSSAPVRTEGKFLWCRDYVVYTSGSGSYFGYRCVTGDKGDSIKGEDAPALSLSASGSSFNYNWIGQPSIATQEIIFNVTRINLTGTIQWIVPSGVVLTDVSETSKKLLITNALSVNNVKSFNISVKCGDISQFVTIFNHIEAVPSKRYLGSVLEDPTTTNPATTIRPMDSNDVIHYIEGDTVLYKKLSESLYEVYRYTYSLESDSYIWVKSEGSDDIFSAGTDLLAIAEEDVNATGKGIQFYKNLVAFNLKAANAEIDALKVRLFEAEGLLGKVNIDEDGNLYGQDAAGRVRWRLNADGSGDIENLVTQLVEAKSIKADPLETEDAQPAVNPFSLNVPKTLFNYYDGINHILNSVVDKSKPTQINVAMIDGSLNYEQLVYQSGARELDSSTTITSWNSGDSLQFRHYKATGNVSAGNAGKECFKTLVNNTGRPVFVYASWNLGGTMNSLTGELIPSGSSDILGLGDNNHDCWVWLLPGDKIRVRGSSWALWGSQGFECNFYFYKSDKRAITNWFGGVVNTLMGKVSLTAKSFNRYVTVHTLGNGDSSLTGASDLVYQVGDAKTYLVEAGNTVTLTNLQLGIKKVTFIEHPVREESQGFYAKKTGAEWVKLDNARRGTNNDYRTGNLSISSPISWSRTLTHVKSDDLIQAINAYSEKTTIITEQSSSQTYIKINGTTVSGNVLRVLKNSNEVKFEFTSGAITTIKKYGAYEGLYLSLESRIQPRNIDSSIKTKDILPKLASSYNIGSNENRYNTGYFLNLIVNSLSVAGSLAASKFLGLLSSSDVRNDNHPPSYYMSKGIGLVPEFKGCSVVGISNGGSYCQVVTQIIWSDGSGGYPMQIAYCQNGKIFRRYGTSNTAWSSWQSIVTEDVLSSYVTKLRADSFSTTEIYKNTTVKSYYGSTTYTKRITLGTSLVRGNVIVKIVANCKNTSLIPNNKIALYKNGARLAEQTVMATTDVTLTVNVTLVKGDILYIYTQNHSTSSNYTININSTTILADIDAGFAY